MKIIILAGGSGTRLWPISRNNFPKQFIKLKSMEKSIFQKTFDRCLKLTELNNIYVVTNTSYKFLVMGQVEEMGYKYEEKNVIIEPEAKNTLPAIYFGVNEIRKKGEDIVAVFPSDHLIMNEEEFVRTIKLGEVLARENIITYGIKPDHPNTGYGYIKPGIILGDGYRVDEFKEKPNLDMAKIYVEKGYLWNAGMFMFDTIFFVEELRKYSPAVYDAFLGKDAEEAFKETPKISIDYGIMEKSDKVAAIPMDCGWNDLGSFDSFYEIFEKDEADNILFGDEIMIDSKSNVVYTEGEKAIALIGVEDLIVVDEKDALLICRKENSQKVKEVVEILKKRSDKRADYHMMSYRPWGSYNVLEEKKGYKIKRLTVLPGKRISYQLHHHRSEHWVVVKGMAKVMIEGEERFVRAGESIFVQSGLKHRLENSGNILLEIIEVQFGEYLEEDDILRFDDDFGRIKK